MAFYCLGFSSAMALWIEQPQCFKSSFTAYRLVCPVCNVLCYSQTPLQWNCWYNKEFPIHPHQSPIRMNVQKFPSHQKTFSQYFHFNKVLVKESSKFCVYLAPKICRIYTCNIESTRTDSSLQLYNFFFLWISSQCHRNTCCHCYGGHRLVVVTM